MRRTFCAAIACALAPGAGFVAPADAAVPQWTSITSPKAPGQHIYEFYDLKGPAPTLFVSGTAHNVSSVDIYCFYEHDTFVQSDTPLNGGTPLTVQTDGTFSGSITLTTGEPCTLRAVPPNSVSFTEITTQSFRTTNYVGSYTGPKFYTGAYQDIKNTSSTPINAAEIAAQPGAVLAYTAQDNGGAIALYPVDDVVGWYHKSIPADMLGVRPTNATVGNGLPDRSEVVVDGHHAYLPATLDGLVADHSLVPALVASTSRSAATGELSMTETAPLRWCAGNAFGFDPATTPCQPEPTGVEWRRTVKSSRGGALTTVHDTFRSTDGKKHVIALELRTGLRPDATIGFRRPGHSAFITPADGTTVNTLPAGAHSLFVTNDVHGTDGAPNHIVWGMTYSAKPQLFYAGNDFSDPDVYVFAYRYQLSVPAGGTAQRAFAVSIGFGSSTAGPIARSAEHAFTPHLTLTAPARKTGDHTPTVKGRLTNAVNGLPATVKLTIGTRSRTVAISPSGVFSTTWSHLGRGKHTVKAVATDPGGNRLVTSVRFTVT